MKTLYLLRHAKSSWADPDLPDHARPLKARGLRDAPAMAAYVGNHYGAPECVLCSDAVRTVQTLSPFSETWALDPDNTLLDPDLYLATSKRMRKRLEAVPNDRNSVLIVGHNPGITDLFNELVARDAFVPKIPTCGFAVLRFGIEKWSKLPKGDAQVIGFYRPKELP